MAGPGVFGQVGREDVRQQIEVAKTKFSLEEAEVKDVEL